jgi:hypothetical protein
MLTPQRKASNEPLPKPTQCGIVNYILHHRDQKFSSYCNNNQALFGEPNTDFRDRVGQLQQDLSRPRNQRRLDKLAEKFFGANSNATNCEDATMSMMLRTRKKTPSTKATKPWRSPISKNADSDGVRIVLPEDNDDDDGDDDDGYEKEYVRPDGAFTTIKIPSRPPLSSARARPPREAGTAECKSYVQSCCWWML